MLTLSLAYAGTAGISQGLSLWQPQMIKSFGLTDLQVGLVNGIPFAIASVAMVLWGRRSDRAGERVWHTALPVALDAVAKEEGRMLGEAAPADEADEVERTAAALATQGYEPRLTEDGLILANCPFDSLAKDHTGLVCGMNHAYVEGVVEGLRCWVARMRQVSRRCEPSSRGPDTAASRARVARAEASRSASRYRVSRPAHSGGAS